MLFEDGLSTQDLDFGRSEHVDRFGDESALDISGLLHASGRTSLGSLLNDESFDGLLADETMATMGTKTPARKVVGSVIDITSALIEEQDELSSQKQSEKRQAASSLAPPLQTSTRASRRSSILGPLLAPAPRSPTPPTAIIPENHLKDGKSDAGAMVKLANLPVEVRPRTSAARPSHILPKDHPSHPRLSVIDAVALQNSSQKPIKKASIFEEEAPRDRDSHTSCGTSIPKASDTIIVQFEERHYPRVPPLRLSDTDEIHSPVGTSVAALDVDLSLPSIGVPLDLQGCTSTPARVGAPPPPRPPSPPREITAAHKDAPIRSSLAKKSHLAVKFDLPALHEESEDRMTTPSSEGHLDSPQDKVFEQIADRPVALETKETSAVSNTLKIKRRASRAFENASAPDERPNTAAVERSAKPSSEASSIEHGKTERTSLNTTSRRASRAFESSAQEQQAEERVNLAKSRRRSHAPGSRRSTVLKTPANLIKVTQAPPSTSKLVAELDLPVTTIRLVLASSSTSATSHTLSQTERDIRPAKHAPVSHKATGLSALTLPRDFDFLDRAAEREAARKHRNSEREQRETEQEIAHARNSKQKASAWAIAPKRAQDDTCYGKEQGFSKRRKFDARENVVPVSSPAIVGPDRADPESGQRHLFAPQAHNHRLIARQTLLPPPAVNGTDDRQQTSLNSQTNHHSLNTEPVSASDEPNSKLATAVSRQARRPLGISAVQKQASTSIPTLRKPPPTKARPFTFAQSSTAFRSRSSQSHSRQSFHYSQNAPPPLPEPPKLASSQSRSTAWHDRQREREAQVRARREADERARIEREREALKTLKARLLKPPRSASVAPV